VRKRVAVKNDHSTPEAGRLIRPFAALALDLCRAENEAALRAVVGDAAHRVLGHGRIEIVNPGAGADGDVEVIVDHSLAGYLRAYDVADEVEARTLLEPLADLTGAALLALRQRELSRRLHEGLRTDRAYFEQLFDVSPEAIVVLDGEDRIVRCNREFERLFGYDSAEAEGRLINDIIVPDDQREEATRLTKRVASGESLHAEAIRQRRDGSTLHVSILATPIMIDGDQVAVYGIYRNITAHKEIEEALRRLSTTDELTGLYNRRGFFLVAEQQRRLAIRKKAELLLLYIDIDNFKSINDQHGHLEGDRVLADIGQLLRNCYRDSDILARVAGGIDVLARMGGDEFVVLAVDAGVEGEAILVRRLRERLAAYNTERNAGYVISLSVGAVRVAPNPETTIDAALAAADRLMYEDKRGLMKL
jgi:diguanylate cyclase (GGDEF)-like protein/PAS domain S-box-containing protein